ncbi:hypothetical protein [Kaarinaea lacus]
MSTKDKTREKLLNSIKKTKKVISDQPDTKQEHARTYAKPAAKTTAKSGSKATPTAKSAPAKRPTRMTSSRATPATDPYQSRGRVWPD